MATETREQVLGAFHCLEQVHPPYRATTSASFVAVYREEQTGHAVRVHQPTGNNALHSLVPAGTCHHKRTLTVVFFRRFGTGDLRELRFDGTALVVRFLKHKRQLASGIEIVGHQKIERRLRIAHASSRVQARNNGEAEIGGAHALAGYPRLTEERS